MLVRKSETRIQRRTGRGIDKRNRRVKGRTRGKRGRKERRERGRVGTGELRVVSKPLETREKSGRTEREKKRRGGR